VRIIYVTANLPYGTDEAFLVAEVAQLSRAGHEVVVVPRSPTGVILHGSELLDRARMEGLFSPQVLQAAAMKALSRPAEMGLASQIVRASRSLSVAAKNLAVLPKACWLAGFAADWGADHIHCHWAGTTATMAMAASHLCGVPWSFTAHRWDIVENNLLAAKMRTASMVRFICADGLRMAREIGIPYGCHARVIHMGVAVPPRPSPPNPDRHVVLCPARLVKVKGHRFLLEAWKILHERGVRAELWLAGGGELSAPLQKLSSRLGISKWVRFLGPLPHSRLLEMYEWFGISAVVLASRDVGAGCHEGIPVALIEAMSYGIPVIGTRTGGIGELIQGGTGLLVPPEDPPALAGALQSVIQDPVRAARLGDYGRKHVSREFDVVGIVSELERAFYAARARTGRPKAEFAIP
jgi:glycosyltransferase involved in cell wall biosynthesis